jgi:integrin-linked kinase-associated serine/threonine phosphatase 2C
MSSAEVCGFVEQHENKENVAEALVMECRNRWDDMNKNKKSSSKVGDVPYLKFGCDDITAVVALLHFDE